MLTGRRPFAGHADQLFDEILNREPKPPRQINDRIPKELEEICQRCLSKSVAGRFSTCLDLAQALRGWLQLEPAADHRPDLFVPDSQAAHASTVVPAHSSTAAETGPRPKEFRKSTIVAGLLLFAATGLGLLYLGGWFPKPGQDSSTQANPTIGVPGQPGESQPRILELNRWHPLLDHRPEILSWAEALPDSSYKSDPGNQQLTVTSSQPGIFTLGDFDSIDFRIEVRISKSVWLGSSGIIWGVHDGAAEDGSPSVRCQALYLYGFLDEGRAVHRLQRDLIETWNPPGSVAPAVGRHQFLSAEVDPPDATEIRLEMTLPAGQLRQVRWNGKSVPAICDGPQVQAPQPLVSDGPLGLYNQGGTSIFRDARIQLLRSAPPN
jgi:hypothetical protein